MRLSFSALTLALAAAACDRPPSAEALPEWTPGDHDHIEDKARTAQGGAPGAARAGAPGSASSAPQNLAQLIDAAWQAQCASCHGVTGKGDGPQAPMFKPADLTREDWQSKVTDDEMIATIRSGKGKMPKFDAPESVLRGLVARIRFYRGK